MRPVGYRDGRFKYRRGHGGFSVRFVVCSVGVAVVVCVFEGGGLCVLYGAAAATC